MDIEFELYDGTKLAWDRFSKILRIGQDAINQLSADGMRSIYEIGYDKILKLQCHREGGELFCHPADHQAATEAEILNSIREEHLQYFPRLYDVGAIKQEDGIGYEHNLDWILVSRSRCSERDSTDQEVDFVSHLTAEYGISDVGGHSYYSISNWWIDEDTDAPFIYDCGLRNYDRDHGQRREATHSSLRWGLPDR